MQGERPYWKVAISLMFSLIATLLFVVVGIKLLIYFMPFVIGWFISYIANPLVKWLERRLKIVRKLGSAIIIILVLGLIVVAGYFGISKLVTESISFINGFPDFYKSLLKDFNQAGDSLQGILVLMPQGVQSTLRSIFANLGTSLGDWISNMSAPTVAAAGNFAKALPAVLIAVVVTVVSAYFFITDREEVIQWFKKVSPQYVQRRMEMVIQYMKSAVGGYFKAQFKIMAVVFIIVLIGLSILKVNYVILISLLVALLDFLPIFGTGTAVIPWAIFKVLTGDYKMAAGLIIIYAVTQVVRHLIQPKLVADSIGLNPLVTLVLLYFGYKVGSVGGMIIAIPIGMIIINMYKARAFDYILDDAKILIDGILSLRDN
ncbi:MAG: sporulation integral membrane protein YtvI [Lachnospiraceae bacterium]|nr:sporulation integral membrane protein YtvI [Lachnospiraceae bacterium]